MKTVAIIQARMGSSRLPGKVLADIGGTPMLGRVVERVRGSTLVDETWIATTRSPADDPVEALAHTMDIPIYRGDDQDVLGRYHGTARRASAQRVVRVTGDCPLMDPAVVDDVTGLLAEGVDYASNLHPPSFPDGLDVEAFTMDALAAAAREASLPSEREHVTPYIWNNPDRFRIRNLTNPRDLSGLRWTVDEPQDLEFVRSVFSRLFIDWFSFDDVLALLEKDPSLMDVNAGFVRNEGYLRSLQMDRREEP